MTRGYETPEEKALVKARATKWKAENRKKANLSTALWYAKGNRHKKYLYSKNYKKHRPANYWFNKLKHRSQNRKLPFDLTVEFLEELFKNTCCQVTGIPFKYELVEGKSRMAPWSPSIDQVRPGEGYTKDNVQLVCWAYNVAKGEWPSDVVFHMAKHLIKNNRK